MARRVFISFRFSDGHKYKEKLSTIFNSAETEIINCSEDKDQSTCQRRLYKDICMINLPILV